MSKISTWRSKLQTKIWAVMLVLYLLIFSYGIDAQVIDKNSLQDDVSTTRQNYTISEPNRLADDFITASLVIAEPGEVMYSILGHAALHMQCPYYNLDCVFSYESEGVQGKVLRFLLGDLKMGMEAMPLDVYLSLYQEEGRGVREFPLNLPAEVKSELWRMCDELVDEGIYLPYDYIKRGCAVSIVHSVDNAIRSANKIYGTDYKITYPDWGKPFERTLREIFYDNAPHGWSLFYCMTLAGGQVDNPDLPKKEKLIAPKELVQTWQQATIAGKPIISDGRELLPNVNEYKGDTFTPLYASLILLLFAIIGLFWKREYISWLLLALQTALGCLMVWLLFSPLPGSEWSWLIIPFNPLPAIFWKWRDKWGIYYAALVLAWSIGMLCAPHRLVEYAHIVWAIAFALVAMKPWMSLILNIKKHNQHK